MAIRASAVTTLPRLITASAPRRRKGEPILWRGSPGRSNPRKLGSVVEPIDTERSGGAHRPALDVNLGPVTGHLGALRTGFASLVHSRRPEIPRPLSTVRRPSDLIRAPDQSALQRRWRPGVVRRNGPVSRLRDNLRSAPPGKVNPTSLRRPQVGRPNTDVQAADDHSGCCIPEVRHGPPEAAWLRAEGTFRWPGTTE